MNGLLSIDRIRIVLPVVKDDIGMYLDTIEAYQGEPGCKVWKQKYVLKAALPIGSKAKLNVTMGRQKGNAYVSFDFSPASLTAKEIDCLRVYFMCMPYMEEGAWMTSTTTSYIEFALDYSGKLVKDVLPFVPTRKTSRWWPGSSNPTPTQYLGARASDWELRVYDRNARLLAKGIPAPGDPLLRVEVSLRRTKLAPQSLMKLANPFQHVRLARLNQLDSLHESFAWSAFVTDCWNGGSGFALSKTKITKAECYKRLESCVWEWWQPGGEWEQLPEALKSLDTIAFEESPVPVPPMFGSVHAIAIA